MRLFGAGHQNGIRRRHHNWRTSGGPGTKPGTKNRIFCRRVALRRDGWPSLVIDRAPLAIEWPSLAIEWRSLMDEYLSLVVRWPSLAIGWPFLAIGWPSLVIE